MLFCKSGFRESLAARLWTCAVFLSWDGAACVIFIPAIFINYNT
ncbi:hypothetical protein DWUX_2037 [Desulfovibrio diazotrophicus]|nr:hypothetical protein DWUX_2037 [Desulfovibrio diazotrophicus]